MRLFIIVIPVLIERKVVQIAEESSRQLIRPQEEAENRLRRAYSTGTQTSKIHEPHPGKQDRRFAVLQRHTFIFLTVYLVLAHRPGPRTDDDGHLPPAQELRPFLHMELYMQTEQA